ncbi:MAG: ATP-binding protein [Candidatus Saccharimonadales bacterium]
MTIITLTVITAAFVIYRKGLRFAKGVERGIKMVPILINLPPSSEDIEVGQRDIRDVIQERISQAEVLYSLIAGTTTKGFKSKFFGQRHIGFEIVAINGTIRLYAAVPVALVSVVKQAILTAYPGAQLDEVEDHNIFSDVGKISGTYGGEIKLKQPYSYPISTAQQLKRDAMQAIIKALASIDQGDGASLQILIRPARNNWTKVSESLVKKKREDKDKSGVSVKDLIKAPFRAPDGGGEGDKPSKPPKQLSNLEQTTLDLIEEKTRSPGYETLIRVVSSSSTAAKSQAITSNIVSAFSLFDAPGLNGFKFEAAKNIENFVTDFIFRFFPPEKNKMILSSVELASLFHLPDDQFAKTAKLERQSSKQVEGPTKVSQDGLLLGHNTYHEVQKEIRLSDEDRRRHLYIVGQTGTGKTTVLSNLMVQDMVAGKGFAFIDPHGDEAENLLGMVPKSRMEDVIYFDPAHINHPVGLNLFEHHTEDQKDFLIQEAINMLYRLYDPQHTGIIGPRYEHLFRNAALVVMADPDGGTFVDIPKLFRDPQFVRQKLEHVQDQSVREFWQKEMPQSQRSNDFGEVVSWFVSKFGAFLNNQLMRNTIGQAKSAFDLREVMDGNKILIANLSKGRLGELNSQLLGMIFVMKFQAAAMSRANIPESERKDFSLYVDEFQNFSTESFAFILSEARKYRLSLIVANQFISQLSEEVRDAVFGNVGTVLSFRTGPADADFLVKQFSPSFNEHDLVNLPNFNAVVRLMHEGLPSKPFNIMTLPPLAQSNKQVSTALKHLSGAKYGRPRLQVEEEIFNRLSTKSTPNPFESLANTQGLGDKGSTQGSSNNPKQQTSSSFLDEWLEKRKKVMDNKPSTSTTDSDSQNTLPELDDNKNINSDNN